MFTEESALVPTNLETKTPSTEEYILINIIEIIVGNENLISILKDIFLSSA